jgi:hypothetical protein
MPSLTGRRFFMASAAAETQAGVSTFSTYGMSGEPQRENPAVRGPECVWVQDRMTRSAGTPAAAPALARMPSAMSLLIRQRSALISMAAVSPWRKATAAAYRSSCTEWLT